MLDVAFRKGDVIRFRRGANEYTGKISRLYKGSGGPLLAEGCTRRSVTGFDGPVVQVMQVRLKHVLQIVTPVLTEKEHAALCALRTHAATEPITVRDLRWARHHAREEGAVTGACLSGLERRGLVAQSRDGLTGLTSKWALTEEGRRVARAI